MAFPGRLNEKKRNFIDNYFIVSVVILLVAYAVSQVVKFAQTPLTQTQINEINIEKSGGRVSAGAAKTNKFTSDVNQILNGDPLNHAPDKIERGSAVVYKSNRAPKRREDPSPSKDYYSDSVDFSRD